MNHLQQNNDDCHIHEAGMAREQGKRDIHCGGYSLTGSGERGKTHVEDCRIVLAVSMAWAFGLLSLVCGFGAAHSHAQSITAIPAPSVEPLTKMPYSPSLDVTSLDRAVDPCIDFYRYSCGGWIKNNPIPADQASWSVYGKLTDDNQQFLWGILEADAKATGRTPVQQKVGDYFESCMNTVEIDRAGLAPLAPALARLDGLSTRWAVIAALAPLQHNTSGDYFFRTYTGQDAVNSSKVIVELGAGGLGLPDRDYYIKTDAHSVQIRREYVAYIEEMLTLSGEVPAQAKADAGAIAHLETVLAKASLTRVDRRDPHKTYHPMPLSHLQRQAPAVEWAAFFGLQGAPGLTSLNVSQPEFIRAVLGVGP